MLFRSPNSKLCLKISKDHLFERKLTVYSYNINQEEPITRLSGNPFHFIFPANMNEEHADALRVFALVNQQHSYSDNLITSIESYYCDAQSFKWRFKSFLRDTLSMTENQLSKFFQWKSLELEGKMDVVFIPSNSGYSFNDLELIKKHSVKVVIGTTEEDNNERHFTYQPTQNKVNLDEDFEFEPTYTNSFFIQDGKIYVHPQCDSILSRTSCYALCNEIASFCLRANIVYLLPFLFRSFIPIKRVRMVINAILRTPHSQRDLCSVLGYTIDQAEEPTPEDKHVLFQNPSYYALNRKVFNEVTIFGMRNIKYIGELRPNGNYLVMCGANAADAYILTNNFERDCEVVKVLKDYIPVNKEGELLEVPFLFRSDKDPDQEDFSFIKYLHEPDTMMEFDFIEPPFENKEIIYTYLTHTTPAHKGAHRILFHVPPHHGITLREDVNWFNMLTDIQIYYVGLRNVPYGPKVVTQLIITASHEPFKDRFAKPVFALIENFAPCNWRDNLKLFCYCVYHYNLAPFIFYSFKDKIPLEEDPNYQIEEVVKDDDNNLNVFGFSTQN